VQSRRIKRPRAVPSSFRRFVRKYQRVLRFAGNYLSTLAFIGLSWWVVSDLSGFHRNFLQGQWQFGMFEIDAVLTIHDLFLFLIALYAVVLVPFYLRYPWIRSKAFVFLHGLWYSLRRLWRPASRSRLAQRSANPWRLPFKSRLSPSAKQAGLALLLKFYFAPLMINWCLDHANNMGGSLVQVWDSLMEGVTGRALFDSTLFWACFQTIFFVDTFLFTLGYIVETPALKNRIKSVEPTFLGWAICLACYPPFNNVTSQHLPWQSVDFPAFESDWAHFTANITLLVSFVVYSWASVALGFKASNLTNRGIVSRGPYRFIRHPAYATKNFAWWSGILPAVCALIVSEKYEEAAYVMLFQLGWTTIYFLRAITEERHLLMGNNGYAEYMARVRKRFIPGVV
jgi:protein-S-isoprenylcysteine O-methyltransferase Ste14